jgi:hypothetical protein
MIAALLSKLPVLRPADWGWKVTVCIGVLCESRKAIVCITDNKASFQDFSAEKLVLKNYPFYEGWTALPSGNDAEYFPLILEQARSALTKIKPSTSREIALAIDTAYQEQRQSLIETTVLRKYGFTSKTFMREGKKLCSDTLYNNLCEKIAAVTLSAEFLLCGFDNKGVGHVLCAGGDKSCRSYDHFGVWAIGTGQHSALASLSFQASRSEYSVHSRLEEAVYAALTAKFMAESASDVGKSTFAVVMRARKSMLFVPDIAIDILRKAWELEGAPRRSLRALAAIPHNRT